MKNLYLLIIITTSLLLISCSARGINDEYVSSTEQRLVSQSIDKLCKMLPDEDFEGLSSRKVFVEPFFISDPELLKFAVKRFEMELRFRFGADIVQKPEDSDIIISVFFNSIGTDTDAFGIKTPDFVIPGVGGGLGIDIITVDMYHGISEMYYYISDRKEDTVKRGENLKAVIRTDKLSLPVISIPINTLE